MSDPQGLTDVGRFYSTIARPYDLFATSPIFASLRREAVAALDLSAGARVLDIGCGTGGNLPFVDRAVGGEGTYVGVDLSRGMLSRAQARDPGVDVTLLEADASDPPLRGPFDGIVVTFVNGVLQDPESAVASWVRRLRPGGRIVFLDAAGRRGRISPLEWGFRTFVVLAAPPGTRRRSPGSPNEILIDRIEAAHETLAAEASVERTWTRWRGFVRMAVATTESAE